jgi:hypothetical protein
VNKFKLAIDFDGTIVDHRYPDIGPENPGALCWIKKWMDSDKVELSLWTMRSDMDSCGPMLSNAVAWCSANGITFDFVNSRVSDVSWTNSPKLYAHAYIDDSAVCAPLIQYAAFKRPCINWEIVGPIVDSLINGNSDGK